MQIAAVVQLVAAAKRYRKGVESSVRKLDSRSVVICIGQLRGLVVGIVEEGVSVPARYGPEAISGFWWYARPTLGPVGPSYAQS